VCVCVLPCFQHDYSCAVLRTVLLCHCIVFSHSSSLTRPFFFSFSPSNPSLSFTHSCPVERRIGWPYNVQHQAHVDIDISKTGKVGLKVTIPRRNTSTVCRDVEQLNTQDTIRHEKQTERGYVQELT